MDTQRAQELIEGFSRQRILVIGDVVLDHYVLGEVTRLNPEAPVPVLHVRDEYERSGGAGNVAKNCAGLGIATTLVSVVGDDAGATAIEEAARAEGYTPVLIRDASRPTIRKTRHIADNKVEGQQLLRVDVEETHRISKDVEERVLDVLRSEIEKGVDGIIVSDYAKGVITRRVAEEILDLASHKDILVAADVKPSRAQYFVGGTLVSPNIKEAHEYVGLNPHEDNLDPAELAKMVYMKMCADVYLTMSADGMYSYRGGASGDHVPQTAKAIDPSGAGDTVIAVLLPALLSGASEVEAAKLANAAGGVVIQKVGSVGLERAELEAHMANEHSETPAEKNVAEETTQESA